MSSEIKHKPGTQMSDKEYQEIQAMWKRMDNLKGGEDDKKNV